MNNNQKYSSLFDYSTKLSRSMQKFDTVFWSKPPKQMGSFNVTMRSIETIVDNIKEIQKTRDEMRKLTTLDLEAIKDNKSAKKVAEQINSIKAELNQNYERLKEQFFKQIELAGKQCKEVSRAIKDKDERKRFNEASRDFELMVYESRTEKYKIPFNEKDDLTQLRQDQTRREHEEQERKIDDITSSQLEDTDKLQSALSSLATILAISPKDDLSERVREEVAQIKKVLPPKTIAVAKDNLERLRHSSHLLIDLEQISEIMKTTHRFMGSDGKLQKINKQFENLQTLLEKSIKEQQQRKMNIEEKNDIIQRKFHYATNAVKTYSNILDGNVKLEQEQMQIRNNTHGLYAENERIMEDERKAEAEAKEIHMKPEYKQEWNDGLKIDQLYERARNDRQAVKNNEVYMTDKMFERAVAVLPYEYTNMKKRLQSVSSLYQITQSQNLSTGGMSR